MGRASRTFRRVFRGKLKLSCLGFSKLILNKLIYIQQIVYMPAILFVKVAILLQFRLIFVTSKRSPRWYILQTLIGLNAIFFTAYFFITIFRCVPRRKVWDPKVRGTCIDIKRYFVAWEVINIFDDFLILILPLVWIWKLHMQTQKKIGISVLFATGLLYVFSSILMKLLVTDGS